MTSPRAPRNRRRMLIGCAIAAAAVAVPASGQAAPADYIYWSSGSGGSTIGRVANQAGATANASFITGLSSPMNLSVLESRLYWAGASGVGRSYTDGTDVQSNFLPVAGITEAVSAAYNCPSPSVCPSPGPYLHYGVSTGSGGSVVQRVIRANIDGSSPTTFIDTSDLGSSNRPTAIAQSKNPTVGVAMQTGLSGVGLGRKGSFAWQTFSPSSGTTWSTSMSNPGVAADATYLYMSRSANGAIDRINMSTGTVTTDFVSSAGSPQGVAVDDDYIYWINMIGGNATIGRVSKSDGTTGRNTSFIQLQGTAFGIAVGSTSGGGSGGGSDTGGGTGGSTSGGSSSSSASGSSSGSSGSSTPSNTFTARKGAVSGNAITTRVTVPGAGRLAQRGTRQTRSSMAHAVGSVTACTGARTAAKAGTVTITCTLNAATRAARRSGAVTLRVSTTFRPTGGTARTSTQTVVLPKLGVRPSAVTG